MYPLPLARNAKSSHKTKIKNKFQFLGRFMAKAVLDNRIIDLPFSRPFYQWLLQVVYSVQGALHNRIIDLPFSRPFNQWLLQVVFSVQWVLDNRIIDLPFSRPFYQWLLQVVYSV